MSFCKTHGDFIGDCPHCHPRGEEKPAPEEIAAWSAPPLDALSSERFDFIGAALAKAQGAMSTVTFDRDVEVAMKSGGRYRYSYATLAAIWDIARKPLADSGIAVLQTPTYVAGDFVLVTQLIHSSGQWFRSVYPIRPTENLPQAIGSAITYARRYTLASMLGITSADDDDDAQQAQGKPRVDEPRPAATTKGGRPIVQSAPANVATPAETKPAMVESTSRARWVLAGDPPAQLDMIPVLACEHYKPWAQYNGLVLPSLPTEALKSIKAHAHELSKTTQIEENRKWFMAIKVTADALLSGRAST